MAERRIATLVDPALEVMYELLTSTKTPPAVRKEVAKDILDRAGFKPIEKHELREVWDGDLSTLSEDALERVCRHFWSFIDPARREELQRKAIETEGPVIEAEFVRVPEAPQIAAAVEEKPVEEAEKEDQDEEDGW